MPSSEQIRAFQQLRGAFLGALWDAEAAGDNPSGACGVDDLMAGLDGPDLSPWQVKRLVYSLTQDHLLETFVGSIGDLYPQEVKLTSSGRFEVESWYETQQPTKHLPYPPAVVNNFHGPVSGSAFVQNSNDVSVTINNQHSERLAEAISAVRDVVADSPDATAEQREDAEDDLASLQNQAVSREPDEGRIRRVLRRLQSFGQIAGSTAVAIGRAEQAIEGVVHGLGG